MITERHFKQTVIDFHILIFWGRTQESIQGNVLAIAIALRSQTFCLKTGSQ